MISSFRTAAYSRSSIGKTSTEIWVLSFAKQLLVKTQLQEQCLVPLAEHPVQSPPKAYLEPNHTSKLTTLSIFTKELHFRCLCPLTPEVSEKAVFVTFCPTFSINLLVYFLKKKVVVLKAAFCSSPISHLKHLQWWNFWRNFQILSRVLLLSCYFKIRRNISWKVCIN